MSRPELKKKLLSVSLRIAAPSALLIAVSLAVILYFLSFFSAEQIIITGGISFILSIIIISAFSQNLLKKRIISLQRISKNISRKRFEDYENIEHRQKDEL